MDWTFRETIWCLNQMLSCYFLKYFMFVGNLLILLISPIFININQFQRIKIRSIFLSYCIYLAKSTFTQKLKNVKIIQTYYLRLFACTFRLQLLNLLSLLLIFLLRITFEHYHRFYFSTFSWSCLVFYAILWLFIDIVIGLTIEMIIFLVI